MLIDVKLLSEFNVNGKTYCIVRIKGGACTLEKHEYLELLELYTHDTIEKIA